MSCSRNCIHVGDRSRSVGNKVMQIVPSCEYISLQVQGLHEPTSHWQTDISGLVCTGPLDNSIC